MRTFASTRLALFDPEPLVGVDTGKRYPAPFSAGAAGEAAYHRPRTGPAFLRPNPKANPILVEFREDPFFPDLRERAASYLEVNFSDMGSDASVWDWTPAEMEHAERVLTRIAEFDLSGEDQP